MMEKVAMINDVTSAAWVKKKKAIFEGKMGDSRSSWRSGIAALVDKFLRSVVTL